MGKVKVYKNKKWGTKYTVLLEDVINCTNSQDGQIMVLYRNTEPDEDGLVRTFVREREEFLSKFERVQ